MHESVGPLVFVGSATWDTIALVERPPKPDERIVAAEIRCAGGGPAATAAVAASRLGCSGVVFVGVVGADDEGDRIVGSLADEGVDVTRVIREPISAQRRQRGHRGRAYRRAGHRQPSLTGV